MVYLHAQAAVGAYAQTGLGWLEVLSGKLLLLERWFLFSIAGVNR